MHGTWVHLCVKVEDPLTNGIVGTKKKGNMGTKLRTYITVTQQLMYIYMVLAYIFV